MAGGAAELLADKGFNIFDTKSVSFRCLIFWCPVPFFYMIEQGDKRLLLILA